MSVLNRKKGKFHNKFCNVVDQLIILEELGFKEDNFHRWEYALYVSERKEYSKTIIASGDYLYLQDKCQSDVNLCVLWNRDFGGTIKKPQILEFINLLKLGNVEKKKTS